MMKINLKNLGRLMVLGFLTFAITSCEKLPLQDRFEFDAEVPVLTPYKNLTALQFLELNPNNEFNYMLKIVKLAGMEAEYSKDVKNRTYLILKDTAFIDGYPNSRTGRNDYTGITKDLTGTDKGDLATVDVARLKKLLNYHIIDEYIDQRSPLLALKQQEYIFQSLVAGDEGRVSIRRTEFLGFNFNTASIIQNIRNSPTNGKSTNRVQHGYVFKNGIGHLLGQYIRYKPF